MILETPTLKSQALLELHLFGTGEVWLGGRRLEVGSRKTLALLAYLALEGETPRSVLANLFWSDYDDESARRNLRRELHRLREAGLRDQVLAVGEHLRLTDSVFTDVQDFFNKMQRSQFAAALKLYKSELLKGLRLENTPLFDAWLESERTELVLLCNQARLRLAEDLETKGDWVAALALHQLVLKEDVLQERQHREVMRLHYLLGNREAALVQFEQCTAMLETELGLEPLPATVRLAQQIRAARTLEPSTELPFVATKTLVAPLIGRKNIFKTLSSSLEPLLVLLGEAGVGKTVLLEKFAPNGLYFGFRQVSSQTPLYAFAEVLRGLLVNLEARVRFDQLPSIWQQETARLIPELAVNQTEPQERILFLEGLARALECLNTENQPLIFDDLHWADTASLELVTHLVQRSKRENQPITIIAAARPEELSSSTKLILQQLEVDGLSKTINLEALTKPEVQELVLALSGSDAPLFSSKLFSATTGNPFFVLETIRYLFEQKQLETWENLEAVSLTLPPSVQNAVLKRIDSAGSAVRRLLETAALTENGFMLETIQPATALNEWEGLEGLEQAVSAHLLQRLEIGFGFNHDLIRQALQNALSPERQRLIHNKLAISLEQTNGNPSQIAFHLEQSHQTQAAVPWRIQAARNATQVYAHTIALEQYSLALAHQPTPNVTFEILQARVSIWEQLGQTNPWQTDLTQMAAIATQPGSSATVEFATAIFELAQQRPANALACAERVLTATNDTAIQAQAHHWAGAALLRQSNLEAARRHFQEALELLPDPAPLRGKILMQLFQVEFDANNTQAAKTYLETAMQHNQISQNKEDEILILNHQGRIALNQGDNEIAASIFETAQHKVKPINNPSLERSVLMGLATSYSRLLRLDEALTLLEQALHLAQITEASSAKGGIYHTIGAIHRRRTDYGQTIGYYQDALKIADQLEQHPARIFRRLTLADLHLDIGDHHTALTYLEPADALIQQTGVRTEREWCDILKARQQRQAGHLQTARQALEGHEPQNPFERVIWLTELAQMRLTDKDYSGVLQLLEGEDAPNNTLSQLLGIRIQALAALQQPLKSELEQIQQLIGTGLLPMFHLFAHVTLTRSYRLLNQANNSKPHRLAALTLIQNVAESLGDYPEQRSAWLEQYAEML